MDTEISIRKHILIWMTGFLVFTGLAAVVAEESRLLPDSAWREDVEAVGAAIREIHPRPFRTIDQATFDAAEGELLDDLPNLTDKEIIVRLAGLVALVDDGHTRLAIPRQHPEIGLEFGHTPTPRPEQEELWFSQLPLAFEQFSDGIFVVAAHPQYENLVGQQLVSIGEMSTAEAMEAVSAITFAENEQLDILMGADRLTLPEALVALGVINSPDNVALQLVDDTGKQTHVSVAPLADGPLEWVDAFSKGPNPLRLEQAGRKFWSEYLEDENVVYMQMDEIGDDDIPLAEFVVETLNEAEQKNAKLVIDVRNNFGGSGGLNRTLVTSIIANDALNRHDRTFVLIGRRTFSAAQMLVNELEQYTRVTFVGEPTGSRPDHFGDPKKIRLPNSGLTLRVSRLHWSSYTAFDERDATDPDLFASWTSADYFSGGDPALATALSDTDTSLKALLHNALERVDMQQIARYTLDSKLSPDTYADDFSELLVELGAEFEAEGQADHASLTYQVGLYFYPDNEVLKAAFELLTAGG